MADDKAKGVSMRNLVEGTEIEFDMEHNVYSEEEEDCFTEDFKGFQKELRSCLESDEHSISYEKLSHKMTSVTADGLVKQLVFKEGMGPIIPKQSFVLIHYNAYVENQNVPFDSTYQRNRPFKFLLGDGRIVYGLDIAIATMRKGGVSWFLVSPSYAYGPMGCPPRVPGNAFILYEVEVINFIESSDAIEFEQMSAEEQKYAPFQKVLLVCKAEHQLGNDLFKRKIYYGAMARYRRAVSLLEDISVANEEEDEKRKSFLLKSYLNTSLCCLNVGKSKGAAANAKSALRLDPNNTKALFRFGKAKLLDSEYDDAKKLFISAQKNEPFNKEINMAILKLEEKKKAFENFEVNFCKNIFK